MNGPSTLSHRQSTLPDGFWQALADSPFERDLFQLLRRIDAQAGQHHRLGRAPHPREEPLRIGQEPSMSFAPSTIASVKPRDGSPLYDVSVCSFGLFGPNGPLPLHLTEYVRERVHHHQDRALLEFCNLFHHRLTLLLYRAWADAQPTASLDRRDDRRFDQYLSSLIGLGCDVRPPRDSVSSHARYYMSGHLTRQARNEESLRKILADYFRIPVRIIQNVPMWLNVDASQQSRLKAGRREPRLGVSTLLGIAVRDSQHKFRIELGPMPQDIYNRFLPDGDLLIRLRDWVRQYVGIEFAWDVRLILEKGHSAHALIGSAQKLGLTTWLRAPTANQQGESDQLVFIPEPLDRALSRQTAGTHPLN